MKKYEIIEHTADIGVRAYGENLDDLFKNLAVALFNLVADYQPKKVRERKISLEAETLEELLVNWLNELISVFFTYKFLPADYELTIGDKEKKFLRAKIGGEELGPCTDKIKMEIKAATHHNLKIERESGRFKAEIIFDV